MGAQRYDSPVIRTRSGRRPTVMAHADRRLQRGLAFAFAMALPMWGGLFYVLFG